MHIDSITIAGVPAQRVGVFSVTSPFVEGWTEHEVRAFLDAHHEAQSPLTITASGWKKMARVYQVHHLPRRLR